MRTLTYLVVLSVLSFSVLAEEEIPVNESPIRLHDGALQEFPYRFLLEDENQSRWGYGNWDSGYGYANLGFHQLGPELVLTQKGMKAKKVLESWGIADYKLGKKKSFKSDGKRALVQLAEIDNLKCVVVISRYGHTDDVHRRYRSNLDGFMCKNSGDISIEVGMNFLHCIELKGVDSHFLGKSIDNKCIKTSTAQSDENLNQNNLDNDQEDEDIVKKLEKLKSLFDKDLITQEEYDKERQEILDLL